VLGCTYQKLLLGVVLATLPVHALQARNLQFPESLPNSLDSKRVIHLKDLNLRQKSFSVQGSFRSEARATQDFIVHFSENWSQRHDLNGLLAHVHEIFESEEGQGLFDQYPKIEIRLKKVLRSSAQFVFEISLEPGLDKVEEKRLLEEGTRSLKVLLRKQPSVRSARKTFKMQAI
jgi:hypothetical protein